MTDNKGATMGDAGKAVDAREQLAMAAGIHEDMGQKSLAVAIRLGVKEIDTLRARAERAEAELAELRARVEAAERECDSLRGALQLAGKHLPAPFVQECLDAKAAIAAQQAEGEDRG